jgi:hypothetical protein
MIAKVQIGKAKAMTAYVTRSSTGADGRAAPMDSGKRSGAPPPTRSAAIRSCRTRSR